MHYTRTLIYSLLGASLVSPNAFANERVNLGAKLLFAGWQGDNGGLSSSFNSDEGAQIAFSASYSLDKFYTGLSLQSGKYAFSGTAPDQFTLAGRTNSSNTDIEHREIDLVAGYYFLKNISFFLDLKGINNTWTANSYRQSFGGLGFGVSAFLPVNKSLTLFGSAGFVGRGDIKDNNKLKVGDGSSGALEFGAVFKLSTQSTINAGLKFRTYNFEYLDDSSQTYSINGLFVGYNHGFEL